MLGNALRIALSCLAIVMTISFANAQGVSVDIERTSTVLDRTFKKTGLTGGASATLTFDVEYLYRASSLMGEPVINCGVRIRNLTGSVSFEHQGRSVSVAITPENAALVNIYHVDVLVYFQMGFVPMALKCDAGIVAGEGTQPFNVAGSPALDRTICQFPQSFDRVIPDRYDERWCSALGGGGSCPRMKPARCSLMKRVITPPDLASAPCRSA